MKNTSLIIYIVLVCITGMLYCPYITKAQAGPVAKEDRILILLNGSASMLKEWNDTINTYEAAVKLVSALAGEMHEENDQVGFGLRVYGHQQDTVQHICNDTKREVPFSKDNEAQLVLRLQDIRPKGQGSLGYALQQAGRQDILETAAYRYSVLVITDGNNSCTSDPCFVLTELKKIYPVYKLYHIVVTTAPANNTSKCFDRIFSITGDEQIAPAVATIINDFPKKKLQDNSRVIVPKKPVQEEFFGNNRKEQEPFAVLVADTIITNSVNQPGGVIIRKQSNITTDALKYGYLKLVYETPPGTLTLFRITSGVPQRVKGIHLPGKTGRRIQLSAGEYKLIYQQDTIRFHIKNNMITDVPLSRTPVQ